MKKMNEAWAEALARNDEDAWLEFQVEFQGKLERILRSHWSGRIIDMEELAARALAFLWMNFQSSWKGWQGEAQFWGYVSYGFRLFCRSEGSALSREHRKRTQLEERAMAGGASAAADVSLSRAGLSVDPAGHAELVESVGVLETCLGKLKADATRVVLARIHQARKRTFEEIASQFGESVEALKIRYRRALKSLRVCLEKNGVERLPEGFGA